MNTSLKNNLALLAVAAALLATPALRAQTLSFNVDLNTAALNAQNSANVPFYLDFQLNFGTAGIANTVTLSNFQFTGGGALGSPTMSGTASGSLSSTISLTASSGSQLNELFQQFAAGTTDIKFLATVSQNDSGETPTIFTTALLDNSLGFPAQIFTTAPDTESMVSLNVGAANTVNEVNGFSSLSSADGNTPITGVTAAISAVPEPSTYAGIFGAAVVAFAGYARRFRKAPAAPANFQTIA